MTAQDRRDLSPHKSARAAMYLFGSRYASSGLGSMGFWDTLSTSEKELCRDLVADIERARPEPTARAGKASR